MSPSRPSARLCTPSHFREILKDASAPVSNTLRNVSPANLIGFVVDGGGRIVSGTSGFDTFHQLTYPNAYFGWLSIVPRVGYRGTYYGKTWDLGSTIFVPPTNPLVPDFILPPPTTANPIKFAGDTVRIVFDTGAEASFKISRKWEDVQSPAFGLDGLMHVIQPFTDFSYVKEDGPNPLSVLQFDRFEPSTQLRAIDFPQFT